MYTRTVVDKPAQGPEMTMKFTDWVRCQHKAVVSDKTVRSIRELGSIRVEVFYGQQSFVSDYDMSEGVESLLKALSDLSDLPIAIGAEEDHLMHETEGYLPDNVRGSIERTYDMKEFTRWSYGKGYYGEGTPIDILVTPLPSERQLVEDQSGTHDVLMGGAL